jgi:hypothetical protein
MFGLGSRDVLRVRVCDIKYNCLTVITVKPKPAVRSLIEEIQREGMAHDGRENEPEEQRSPTWP